MPKQIIAADALEWLPKNRRIGGLVLSPPDADEIGADLITWKDWLMRATTMCFDATTGPIVFYTTDRRYNGRLVSKASIVYEVEEPEAQNHYPDFTLKPKNGDKKYIALDVKTTYRRGKRAKFGYTLGGYTSFIKKETPTKNIVHHFDHYESHYIVGFVYTRVAEKKAAEAKTFKVSSLNEIVSPYDDVELFVQEKWRVAGDSAGSGNTTNIGSVSATLEEFREGKGIFQSEDEFLEYWRGYGRTNAERKYKNITDFRKLKGQGGL